MQRNAQDFVEKSRLSRCSTVRCSQCAYADAEFVLERETVTLRIQLSLEATGAGGAIRLRWYSR